jgi:DNA-binding PadR family transcriptional regulator
MLDVAILGVLVEGDLHGYELKKRLGELLGPWSSVSFGSLYPALARLERGGYVIAQTGSRSPVPPAPMSGSLGAELAAFRDRGLASSSRRARKVYSITPEGVAHLRSLLLDGTTDDRSFAVRVAFCQVLEPAERLALFQARRAELDRRLAARSSNRGNGHPDRYRRSLIAFQDDRLAREIAWLDDLITHEQQQASGLAAGSSSSHHGGSTS